MPKQLLIYERAVPVNPQAHGDVSIRSTGDYAYARDVNSVPLMSVEFDLTAPEYPIVFTGEGANTMPAALLGVRDQENLFVDEGGAWTGKYVPAFVRRYPFVFSSEDGQNFTLCIDETFSGVNRLGRGERLFDADGTRTQYLQGVLNFLQSYQAQHEATRAFCARLVELDLLEPMQAQFVLKSGQRMLLSGFQSVSRERLRNLSGEALSRLAKSGDLDLIYANLQSQRNFTPLAERLPTAVAPQGAEQPELAAV